jgi:hypothetical protein
MIAYGSSGSPWVASSAAQVLMHALVCQRLENSRSATLRRNDSASPLLKQAGTPGLFMTTDTYNMHPELSGQQ